MSKEFEKDIFEELMPTLDPDEPSGDLIWMIDEDEDEFYDHED